MACPEGRAALIESPEPTIQSTMQDRVPRLLYVGDVPVESTYHGSALIYRLLSTFDPGEIRVVEGNAWRSQVSRRLPATYESLFVGVPGLLNSRLGAYYFPLVARMAARRARSITSLLNGFQPEAVLTVVHGVSWISAARWALARKLPLHVIVHDDWISCCNFGKNLTRWFQEKFDEVYRQASTRWCASPYMAEQFEKKYDVPGQVLFPTRSGESLVFDRPKCRAVLSDPPFTVAYGGTVTLPGYANSIRMMAHSLNLIGGRVLLFSPLSNDQIVSLGLNMPNIVFRGLVSSNEFIRVCREEADALFVPMTFEKSQRRNMELAFPSKFTDYTCIGLPIIVHGPDYCSAVRFANANQLAFVITDPNQEACDKGVSLLARSPDRRLELAARAIDIGRDYFTLNRAASRFQIEIAKHVDVPEHLN